MTERLTAKLTGAELRGLSRDIGKVPVEPAGVSADAPVTGVHQHGDYVLLDQILSEPAAEAIEQLAKSETAWTLNEQWFLSKHDVVWARQTFGECHSIHNLDELETLRRIGARLIEEKYNAVVGTRFEIKATKMNVGQVVGIHNDSPDGVRGRTEGYRLLYYPNKEYSDSDGGHLLFYSASDPRAIIDGVRPVFNSGVLMRLSDHSYHAVSRVTRGVRYTVALLYWGYPILFEDELKKEVVTKCLRKTIAAGFEYVRYDTTTLAFHLYHTYRLLVEWGVPFSVCLSGLMRRVAGSHSRQPIEISEAEISGLVDEYAVQLIRCLNSGRSSGNGELDRDMKIVQLASMLEKAEDAEGIARGCEFMSDIDGLDEKTMRRILVEVSRLRAEVASASN